MDFDALYFPGGFSSGDYVRAGAIFASRVKSGLKSQVDEYINEGRLILGVCNGFQILVELGALHLYTHRLETSILILHVKQRWHQP
jgi:phosphoribosylformylglycinamidine synthase